MDCFNKTDFSLDDSFVKYILLRETNKPSFISKAKIG